jgi:hypothetical protein
MPVLYKLDPRSVRIGQSLRFDFLPSLSVTDCNPGTWADEHGVVTETQNISHVAIWDTHNDRTLM